MSVTDEVLAANQRYSESFKLGNLAMSPARKLAIVACMDARMTIEPMLGLKTGDAHIIRNAGGIVTDDVVRSLILSQELLGTREFMIINHTDCGMQKFKDEELGARLQQATGALPAVPVAFHAFESVEENVRNGILRLRSHPWVAKTVAVRGFVYDVQAGRLREVPATRTLTA
jgi:carbonic anhydrase